MQEEKRTVLRVEVTPEFKAELLAFCKEYGEKYSTVARIAMREFIASNKKPAPEGWADNRTRVERVGMSIRPNLTETPGENQPREKSETPERQRGEGEKTR